jgi:hypothetical protein
MKNKLDDNTINKLKSWIWAEVRSGDDVWLECHINGWQAFLFPDLLLIGKKDMGYQYSYRGIEVRRLYECANCAGMIYNNDLDQSQIPNWVF